MTTFSEALKHGDVQFGTGADDFLFGRNSDQTKMEVHVGRGGNDQMLGDGGPGMFFAGDGNDSASNGAAFYQMPKPEWVPFDTAEHFYFMGAGRDRVDFGGNSYVNGDGNGDGESASVPRFADMYIAHREGMSDWQHRSKLSLVDIGRNGDKLKLFSDDFDVTHITANKQGDTSGFILRGEPVSKGGGGEWIHTTIHESSWMDVDYRGHALTSSAAKEILHDALDGLFIV